MYWQTCSTTPWLIFFMVSFAVQKKKKFDVVPFVYFFFFSLAWGDVSDEILRQAMSEILLLMFSSRIFMVWSLTLKSLIHFENYFCVWHKKMV